MGCDTFLNDIEFDENGRIISKKEETSNENELEFDEEGKPISYGKSELEFSNKDIIFNNEEFKSHSQESIDLQQDDKENTQCENDNVPEFFQQEDMHISFSIIKEGCRDVNSISLWQIGNDEKGAFFITGTDENILKHSIELRDNNEQLIWNSPIMKLPENTFKFSNKNVYMSSKALREKDLPKGDGIYTALIQENDDEAIFILTVEDNRRESIDKEDIIEFNSEEFLPNDDYEELKNEIEKNEEKIENDVEEQEFEESIENIIEDDSKKIHHCKETFECEALDSGERFLYKIIKYIPTSINICGLDEKTYASLRKNIIIEKIGDVYITVLNNFAFRPIYLLTNNEQYTKWQGNLDGYINNIKDMLSKMYGLKEEEFNVTEKLLIVDKDEYDEYISKECNELCVVNRRQVLERLQKEHKIIVDLTEEECNIICNIEERIIEVNSKGLSYSNLKEQWTEKIVEVLSEFKEEKILFTGLAAFENNYNMLKENFKVPEELSFISLARLVD